MIQTKFSLSWSLLLFANGWMGFMKKIWTIVALGLVAGLQQACESTLPLDDLSKQETEGIAVSALLNPDSTFHVYVTRAYLYTDKPLFTYYVSEDVNNHFFEEYYEGLKKGKLWNGGGDSHTTDNFRASTLADAKVELLVNGGESFRMQYDTAALCFRSDYIPAAGDRVRLQVTGSNGQTTVAESEVPQAQKLEILSMEREERALDRDNVEEHDYLGYVVKFKLRLTDPSNEKNYYRLKVRGVTEGSIILVQGYRYVNDYYMSDDLIFRDERLTQEWAGWEANFSDVFDDSLFDGQQYTFDIETYALGVNLNVPPNYVIELQSLSEDYYLYLKSMMLYRVTASDVFSEGVYIHSNNEGGWGILGAQHGEEHILLWDEEKNGWREE